MNTTVTTSILRGEIASPSIHPSPFLIKRSSGQIFECFWHAQLLSIIILIYNMNIKLIVLQFLNSVLAKVRILRFVYFVFKDSATVLYASSIESHSPRQQLTRNIADRRCLVRSCNNLFIQCIHHLI